MTQTAVRQKSQFPLIDALLLLPEEGKNGVVGICTNTTASGQVLNEIDLKYREHVSVLGTLIVSRDGAERMILNTIVHPTIKYLILFSEESLTFSPSTNLLQAIQFGFQENRGGNYIKNGVAASPQYPNLSAHILNQFREEIIVIPLFMFQGPQSKKIIDGYLDWLKPKIPDELFQELKEATSRDKIYYDSLNNILGVIEKLPPLQKNIVELDAKDFQHLQPPKIELEESSELFQVPFRVRKDGTLLRLDIHLTENSYVIKGSDEFLIAYSLMKFLQDKKEHFSPITQFLMGAELARVKTDMLNNTETPSYITENSITGTKELPLEPAVRLITDKKYYYKIAVASDTISVLAMAFDICEEVFELRSKSAASIFKKLAELNRFEKYEMDILHRMDIGAQIGRASIAASNEYIFVQDFNMIFKINTSRLPFVKADSDSFLDVHKSVLLKTYAEGISEEHGDPWKGPARTASVLAIYRNAAKTLARMPKIYQQGDNSTSQIRDDYKQQLLRFDHDGSYSYGERTRAYFGFDQLERTIEVLQKKPQRAAIIQRFDPAHDMTLGGHDPCPTHDIFFIHNKKLHSFHIARAHNLVNAYPENIFGLYDAYVTEIKTQLGIEGGDLFILSNRGNILLLTEEQRTKKILGEPSKPFSDDIDKSVGPYELGANVKLPSTQNGIAYARIQLTEEHTRPRGSFLDQLENYGGVNTVARAINYLDKKGAVHNNAVLSEYRAGTNDPQADCLVFYQANVFGKKIYATAVFANRSISNKDNDIRALFYLTTQYTKTLSCDLGELILFYVAYTLS